MTHRARLAVIVLLIVLPGCPGTSEPDAGLDAPPIDAPRPDVAELDATAPSDAPTDAGRDVPIPERPDGGEEACWPDEAVGALCPGSICDGPDSWAWDGTRCFAIPCGTCHDGGTAGDCATLPLSREACEAAHAGCEPQLCTATGGEWLWWAAECEHRRCGRASDAECPAPRQVCDCGADREFVAGLGCQPASCPVIEPGAAAPLCTSTGGTWTEGACCPSECGAPCATDCAAPACVCGPLEVFDAALGCIEVSRCYVRGEGERCDSGRMICGEGLVCCTSSCTASGCTTEWTCRVPLCDDDPTLSECGTPVP